jgi:hypothetical protein
MEPVLLNVHRFLCMGPGLSGSGPKLMSINTRLSLDTIIELRQTPGTPAAEPNEQGQQVFPHSGQASARTSSFFKARLLGAEKGIGDGH